MKKKFFAGLTVLLGVSLFVLGCDPGTGGGDGFTPGDDPATGQMSVATANAVFGAQGTGWGVVPGGVEITGFSSETALTSYLTSLALVADSTAIFVINTIDNKHVVKIGAEAFKPKDGTDISNVVALIKLPATLAELGKDVFSGVTAEVVIPKEARDAIIAKAVADEVVDEGEKTPDEILKELSGSENVTIDNPNTPILGGSNTLLVLKADSISDLADHIATARDPDNANKTVIIKLIEDFYTDANSANAPLVIDAGETDNAKPYTIRGLGKDGTALTVGILLANDNVTLEDVKINVTDATKAASIGSGSPRYTAAVSIGRAYYDEDTLTFLTGADLANKNVTVQNSNITIDFTGDNHTNYTHNAGIYIRADQSVTPPENITIAGNTVLSKGRGTNAAQGLSIRSYGPSINITNNSLKSETGATETINGPAAGLFMDIIPGKGDTGTPNITGNTLDGKNIDFYVNVNSTGDYTGIPALFNAKFGTAASEWAAASVSNGFYGNLYAALIGQAKSTGYAGAFFMSFGTPAGKWDGYCFAWEAWEKSNGSVVAVDYWGPTIQPSASVYDAEGKKIDHSGSSGTEGGYRGRIVLADDSGEIGAFHWNPTTAVSNDTYSTVPETPQD